MRLSLLPAAAFAATLFAAGAASANMCVADNLTCPTKMPVGGFCECTSHGQTKDGTSQSKAPHKTNSTAGGCGTTPNAPGCKS